MYVTFSLLENSTFQSLIDHNGREKKKGNFVVLQELKKYKI